MARIGEIMTFTKRRFELRTEQARESAIALIRNLPLCDKRPLIITVDEYKKQRSLDANSYYWMRLGEIADQAFLGGRKYNSDCWHEYAKKMLMPDEVTLKDGTVTSKWVELPDGDTTVISTTQLERKCFAEYTTCVEAFGANLGVHYSERPWS